MKARLTFGFWVLAFGFPWALSLGPVAFAAPQMIFRDSPPPAPMGVGTASVAGTVMSDESTPQPIARVRIDLSVEGQQPRTAYTDSTGAFVFTGIPAGRYSIAATKPAYVRANYGAKRPNRPGTPVTVADGQQLGGLQIRMARGAVITGTIRDESGLPAPGVTVRVMQYRMANGERTLSPVPMTSSIVGETSDDRGNYRIYGLAAGDYIIQATPRPLGTGEVRQMTQADLQSVQRASQPRPAGAPATPPAPPPPPTNVTYAPMFYPNTPAAANAQPVTVAAGEERPGVDLTVLLSRTSKIEGVVTTPGGVDPQSVNLTIVPAGPAVGGGGVGAMVMTFNRVRPDAEGKFTYPGMAPGRYTITARAQGGLWASADVTADGENLSGVHLDLAPGLTISGRLSIEGAQGGATPDLSTARLMMNPANGQMVVMSFTSASEPDGDTRIEPDGRFTMRNVVPGKYRFTASLPGAGGGWTLKSGTAGGKNIVDFPFEIVPGDRLNDISLVFTNQIQDVSGTVQDQAGRPVPDYTIVVFPADKSYWTAARRIQTTRPGTDGKFQIRGMPAGDYRIAALVDIAPGEANDPALLEQLVPASVPFTLKEGERKVQDVKIAGG